MFKIRTFRILNDLMTHDTYDTFRVILPLLTRATREVSKIICNFADDLEIFGEIFDKTIKKDNENKIYINLN